MEVQRNRSSKTLGECPEREAQSSLKTLEGECLERETQSGLKISVRKGNCGGRNQREEPSRHGKEGERGKREETGKGRDRESDGGWG